MNFKLSIKLSIKFDVEAGVEVEDANTSIFTENGEEASCQIGCYL